MTKQKQAQIMPVQDHKVQDSMYSLFFDSPFANTVARSVSNYECADKQNRYQPFG